MRHGINTSILWGIIGWISAKAHKNPTTLTAIPPSIPVIIWLKVGSYREKPIHCSQSMSFVEAGMGLNPKSKNIRGNIEARSGSGLVLWKVIGHYGVYPEGEEWYRSSLPGDMRSYIKYGMAWFDSNPKCLPSTKFSLPSHW